MKREAIMKSERILNTLGQVDEKYIAEAAPGQKTGRGPGWIKGCAAAACLALAVYGGMKFMEYKAAGDPFQGGGSSEIPDGTSPGNQADLPLLTVTENGEEAMGYEGYMAYDVSELINENPWTEGAGLSTLPVFRNPLSYDSNYTVSGADFNAMRDFLLEIARRLGMDTENLTIEDVGMYSPEQQAVVTEKLGGQVPEGYFDPTEVRAEENGVEIRVDMGMTAQITFEPDIALPEEYHFTHYSSYEEILGVAEYLKDTYPALLGMEQPRLNIYGGEYDIYRRQKYGIGFYEAGESLTEEILNYHFRQTYFYCNDEGKLWMAKIYNRDLSEKTGDYPIISTAEARTLLLEGYYITTVPYEIPGQEYIAGVELVYRTGKYEEYYMPYYRFLVELPEMEGEDGLKDYGAYYVPAVQREYIAGIELLPGKLGN